MFVYLLGLGKAVEPVDSEMENCPLAESKVISDEVITVTLRTVIYIWLY
jgi:hypothetical protein